MQCVVGGSEGLDAANPPPSVPADAKSEMTNPTQSGSTGVHASGPDAGAAPAADGPPKVKTEKERETSHSTNNEQ